MLADRPVVLKVTPWQDREFLHLARLSTHTSSPCTASMTFRGATCGRCASRTWAAARLLNCSNCLRSAPASRRTGRSLVEALDQAGRGAPHASSGRGPREFLARAPYAEAICWVGIAWPRRSSMPMSAALVHLDLKPSNVLLAADGQPFLLDFHLALLPVATGQAVPEDMGGTPEYMSPEQRLRLCRRSARINSRSRRRLPLRCVFPGACAVYGPWRRARRGRLALAAASRVQSQGERRPRRYHSPLPRNRSRRPLC